MGFHWLLVLSSLLKEEKQTKGETQVNPSPYYSNAITYSRTTLMRSRDFFFLFGGEGVEGFERFYRERHSLYQDKAAPEQDILV